MSHPWLDRTSLDGELEPFLGAVGAIFRTFANQDSGCVSYGVTVGDERWFVKQAREPAARAQLERTVAFHSAVQHEAVPELRGAFEAADGPVIVHDWVDGELLYHRALAAEAARLVLDAVYDAHVEVERRGFIAADFYDGCIIYDAGPGRVHLCDFAEYRRGPFTVEGERMPGSTRFMAPEEWRHGAPIDSRTNVFTLGRAAAVLLGEAGRWQGTPAQAEVVARATRPDPDDRYQSVSAFVAPWRRGR